MVSHRFQRIAEEIKKEIAQIIKHELKDPRIGFASITEVEVTGDLHYAKVYVSIFGDEEAQRQSMEALNKASGFIRREIGKRVSLRYTPEIIFKFDRSIEQGAKIAKLLTEINEAREEDN
jgi:ribosome-binding factor A